ncbi:MAG: antibiotic biosynthesis monooxygenase [Deltaproteobacteria bacterium]|nr:antibiotic biosynthesis monooxygenase [Deltaproteobacteria bacterium]MBW2595322.1 antibiotic biosynthesis monooxygenase [Deltaproteobacteria bacterium]MBW2649980.1 antibiotic biosynthesis monooxygenase [Deltaproteobacteria bacterium]
MITVVASIRVKSGNRDAFLEIFKANVQDVLKEEGCIEYYPTVDFDTGLPVQEMDGNVITIIEKWNDLQALESHLKTPHMLAYKEKTKDMTEGLTIKVLQNA